MIKSKKIWQNELIESIKTNQELLSFLSSPNNRLVSNYKTNNKSTHIKDISNFPVLIPKNFAKKINKNDINDPILKQVLISPQESEPQPAKFSQDPLQETQFTPIPGLIHKYKSRVLIINSSHCAINCRYCFRRSFPYKQNQISSNSWQKITNYISSNPQINEVIFSGGDPLLMTDDQIQKRVESLYNINHINKIRFHTRIPIVLPNRIDDSFIQLLNNIKYKKIIVIHCNHPNELDNKTQEIITNILKTGTLVYNQAVLLKGINDDIQTQIKLWEKTYNMGILPYYLHMLDPVEGASHFEVPVLQAKNLIKKLQAELPGYLIPKLVQEIPGEPSKTSLI